MKEEEFGGVRAGESQRGRVLGLEAGVEEGVGSVQESSGVRISSCSVPVHAAPGGCKHRERDGK